MQTRNATPDRPPLILILDHPNGPALARVSYAEGDKIVARLNGRVSTYHTSMVFVVPNGAEAHLSQIVGHA
jgi:hypothetical protein